MMQPDLDERWGQLLDGTLEEDARGEVLSAAAADLNQVIAEREGDTRGLLDAIDAVVRQPVSDQLWEDANRVLELALGINPARLINWLVVDSTPAPRLVVIRPMLDPPASAFITDLMVRFGERLERASYLYVTRCEHDWRLINREISVDRATGRITVKLKISKYNGDMLVIEGRPDSILTLADAVLTAVNAVGDRTAFYQDLGPFMETMEQTVSLFSESSFTEPEPDAFGTPATPPAIEAGDPTTTTTTTTVVGRAAVPAPPGPPAPTPYR